MQKKKQWQCGRAAAGYPAAGAPVLGMVLVLAVWDAEAATYRYASSSNRIYVESGGTATLSEIKAALPKAPLELVDARAGIWILRANLFVRDGATLRLHGPEIGGDVGELRLQSNNSTAAGSFVFISAEHGNLHIDSTRITSWDDGANGPDTEYAAYGRAYIRVRSMLASDGKTPLESRMDVLHSDIGYLGYKAAEAYGLVWKVIGSAPNLYDRVNVYGDIIGSRIHHNYFGIYTYGHEGGMWLNNKVHDNVQYGIDPHDDSDNLLIEDNDVHDNGNHGIIASQRCNNVVIRKNRSWSNTGNGIMLHRSSDDGVVEDNETWLNTDSGIALFAVKRATVRNNRMLDNGKYGIRLSMGTADSRIENNEIARSGTHGIYFYQGSDTPEPGDDGRNKRNQFRNNTVRDSGSSAIKMSDSDDTLFASNSFGGNASTVQFIRSQRTRYSNNTLQETPEFRITGTSAVPGIVQFDRQSMIRIRLDAHSTARFVDTANAIFDPDENIYTQATSGGSSSLELTAAQIGSTSTVHTRALRITPSTGSVLVKPTTWSLSGDRNKHWKAQATSAASTLRVSVGDLAPGVRYGAYKGTWRIGLFTADGAGQIAFDVAPGSTGLLTYSVRPE